VDGDVAYEIDGREIPGNWSTGVIPWERTKPYEEPRPTDMQQLYRLNPALVDWAVRDTKDVVLDLKIQKFVWHTDCLRFNVRGHGFSWQPISPNNVSEIPLHFDAIVPRQWQCSFTVYVI